MKKYPEVVYLEWLDSTIRPESGWHHAKEWEGFTAMEVCSVGRVVFEDDNSIVLAGSWYTSEDGILMEGGIRIPKCAIIKRIRVLTTAPRSRKKARTKG